MRIRYDEYVLTKKKENLGKKKEKAIEARALGNFENRVLISRKLELPANAPLERMRYRKIRFTFRRRRAPKKRIFNKSVNNTTYMRAFCNHDVFIM